MAAQQRQQSQRGHEENGPEKIMQIRGGLGRMKEKVDEIRQIGRGGRMAMVAPFRADNGKKEGEQREEGRMGDNRAPRLKKKEQRQEKACQCRP